MAFADKNKFSVPGGFGDDQEDDDSQHQLVELEVSVPVKRPFLPLSRPEVLPLQFTIPENVALTSWSSAFLTNKSPSIQERVIKLFSLQHEYTTRMMEYQEEVLALEQKYAELVRPLYEARRETVAGLRDSISTPPPSQEQGIPNFWREAMKNEPSISDLIAERDEDALSHLLDISLRSLGNGERGFVLVFTFSENEWFENEKLMKRYTYIRAADEGGEEAAEDIYASQWAYHESFGDVIMWREGMNLVEEGRGMGDDEWEESFFSFFTSPVKPSPGDAEEHEEAKRTYEWLLELDFDYGEVFKEKVIPYAVHWYTGEATLYEDAEEEEKEDGSSDDEDADDESGNVSSDNSDIEDE